MKLALLALLPLLINAQVVPGRCNPCSVSARPTLHYDHWDIWFIVLSNEGLAPATLSREEILQRFPTLSPLPNDLAEDTLTAVAAKRSRTWIATTWNIGSPVAVAGFAGTAIETSKKGPLYIAAGLAAANLAVQLVAVAAPAPSKYFAEILPSGSITLPAGAGATYGVVTAFSRNDAALGPFTIGAAPIGP